MEYQDKTLKCNECRSDFVFSAGEQKFFAEKNFTNLPKRCKQCKTKSRSNGNKIGPVFTEAVCAACNEKTVVPFIPQQGRPVFCRECLPQQIQRRSAAQ